MDQQFLTNLEDYMVERQVALANRALEERGTPMPRPRLASSSAYVMSGGHKIAVVRTVAGAEPNAVHSVELMAIFGDEVRRVGCVSTEGQVPITFGPCADEIQNTFDFRL